MEVLAITLVFERRVINQYAKHLAVAGVHPEISGTIDRIPEDERWHVQWVRDRLALVDGSVMALLRTLPEGDVNGFCLSNVGEWLTPDDFVTLLGEVVRVAAPGAVVVFRNFVPRDVAIPPALRASLEPVAPPHLAEVLDRSLVRYQTVVSRVRK